MVKELHGRCNGTWVRVSAMVYTSPTAPPPPHPPTLPPPLPHELLPVIRISSSTTRLWASLKNGTFPCAYLMPRSIAPCTIGSAITQKIRDQNRPSAMHFCDGRTAARGSEQQWLGTCCCMISRYLYFTGRLARRSELCGITGKQ